MDDGQLVCSALQRISYCTSYAGPDYEVIGLLLPPAMRYLLCTGHAGPAGCSGADATAEAHCERALHGARLQDIPASPGQGLQESLRQARPKLSHMSVPSRIGASSNGKQLQKVLPLQIAPIVIYYGL